MMVLILVCIERREPYLYYGANDNYFGVSFSSSQGAVRHHSHETPTTCGRFHFSIASTLLGFTFHLSVDNMSTAWSTKVLGDRGMLPTSDKDTLLMH